jgi:hypothetical protein
MLKIIIKRGEIVKLAELPQYSIALDGYVQSPILDLENHRFSFDHHSGCLRFCTLSTTQQVWAAILLGLKPNKYTVFCNDIDVDTITAIWCLKHYDRCNETLVKKFVETVGIGDAHAGAISLNGMQKVIDWVFAPQVESIKNGDYEKLSDDGLMIILESALSRITQYIDGEALEEIENYEIHSEFNIIRNDPNNWVLVESHDPHVYSALYRANFDRIVLMRPQQDNSIAYLLAKRSDFIDNFPIHKFYEEFNKIEPGWGGGSSLGGSPRNSDGSRSKLDQDTVIEIINASIENREPVLVKPKKRTKKK